MASKSARSSPTSWKRFCPSSPKLSILRFVPPKIPKKDRQGEKGDKGNKGKQEGKDEGEGQSNKGRGKVGFLLDAVDERGRG